jgi:hypothetical protein
VQRRPRVAVLTSGDELAPPGRPLGPGAVHDSNSLTVPALARLAAKAYAASGNFSVLHLLTSALAVQDLLPFVDPDDETALAAARAAYWRAFMATVAAAQIELLPLVAARPWPALRAGAIGHADEHVIKLVDAAVQWQARDPAGPWAAAAARALAT